MDYKKCRNLAIKSSIMNEHFQCGICEGYIIDATTLTECLHSFCKSCIVHFYETIDHSCPTCNNSLNDLNDSIRSDSVLQRLIYNLVPNLLRDELERREKFYVTENVKSDLILNNKSIVNLKLFNNQQTWLNKRDMIKSKENLLVNADTIQSNETNVKYIQCIAQTPVRILGKLLRNKHSIPLNYKIKLTHNGHLLKENETLLEIFTSFIINKNELFEIEYQIRKLKPRSNSEIKKNVSLSNIDSNKAVQNPKLSKSDKSCIEVAKQETGITTSVPQTSLQPLSISPSSSSSSTSKLKKPDFLKLKFRRSNHHTTTASSTSSAGSLASKNAKNATMPRKSKSKKLKLSSDSSPETDGGPSILQKMDVDNDDTKAEVKSSVDKNSQQDTTNNQNSNNLNQPTRADPVNVCPSAPDDGLLDLSLKK